MEAEQQNFVLAPKLEFASTKDLKSALGPSLYYSILSDIENRTNKKATLKQLKKEIQTNSPYFTKFDKDEALSAKFQKEGRDFFTKKEAMKIHRSELSKQLSLPKRQYKGCIATRLKPTDYEFCNEQYDDEDAHYEKYSSLIPHDAIRQKEYNKAVISNNVQAQNILRLSPDITIRELPRGIRLIMKENPEEYEAYLKEIKAERDYLKAIQRNVNRNGRGRRIEKYEEIIQGLQ